MLQFDFNSFSGQTLWTLTFFVIFYFVGLYSYIPFLSETIKLKNMVLNKNSIRDFLYLMIALFVGVLVGIGYLNIFKADLNQKMAQKEYEAAEFLLKNKMTEIQSATKLIPKEGGVPDECPFDIIPVSSSVTEDIFYGLILFGIVLTIVLLCNVEYREAIIRNFGSHSSIPNAARESFQTNHRNVTLPYVEGLIRDLNSLKESLFGSSSNGLENGPLYSLFEERMENLLELKTLLEKIDLLNEIRGLLDPVVPESLTSVNMVINTLAVLENRNQQVEIALMLMEDAERFHTVAAYILGQ